MTLYEELQISETASPAMVQSAWRLMVRECHPDRNGGSDERAKRVNHAHDVLADPLKRKAYDAELRSERQRGAPNAGPFPFDPSAYPGAYPGVDLTAAAQEVLVQAGMQAGEVFLGTLMANMSPQMRRIVENALRNSANTNRDKTA